MQKAQEIYARLIAPIEDRMLSVIGRVLPRDQDALDVLQEVLATVWLRLPRIDRHPNPHALILRMCLNRALDFLRRRERATRRLEKLSQERAARGADHDNHEGRLEIADAVRAALSHLPKKQARAVTLRIMDNLDYPEVAAVLGCREATARSHFSKGMARLRPLLQEMGFQ